MTNLSSELRKALRDYAAVVSAQLGVLPLSLLWLGLIARLLGPQALGSYLVGIAVVQFLFRILIGWASDTVIRFGASEALQPQRLTRTVSTRALLQFLGLGLGVVSLECARPVLQQWAGLSPEAVHLLCVVLIAHSWWDLGLSISRTVDAIPRYAAGAWIRQCLLVLGAGALWMRWAAPTIEAVLVIEAAASILMGSWLIGRVGRRVFSPSAIAWPHLLEVIRYAWSNVVAFLTGYLVDWIDLYVIRAFLGVMFVGLYQFGYRLMLLASSGLMGTIVVTVPLFMRWKAGGSPEKITAFLDAYAPRVTWLWSMLMTLLIPATPLLVHWLGGPAYHAAGPILMVLWAGLAFQALSVMTTPLFSVHDALPLVMILNLVMAGINIVGDLIAVPLFGIIGAAWATAVAYTIIGLLYGWFACRRFGIRLGSAWLWPWMGWAEWGICQVSPSPVARAVLTLGLVSGWALVVRAWKFAPVVALDQEVLT